MEPMLAPYDVLFADANSSDRVIEKVCSAGDTAASNLEKERAILKKYSDEFLVSAKRGKASPTSYPFLAQDKTPNRKQVSLG